MKRENENIDPSKRLSTINEDMYRRKKPERGLQTHVVDDPKYQAQIEKIFELVKQGMRSNEILTLLHIEDETMSEAKFAKILGHVYKYAETEIQKDREYVFQLHMARYENFYNKSIQMVDFWGRPLDRKKDWHIIRARYNNAMDALKNKENLLGLHDKSLVFEFNDHKAIVIEKEEARSRYIEGLDLDKLNLEERIELLNLIKEARTVPIEGVQRVIVKKTVVEINQDTLDRSEKIVKNTINDVETHDIEFEEMPQEVVKKFKDDPVKEEIVEDVDGPKFIDNVPKNIEVKQAQDVSDSINKSLLEQFKKKIKEQKNK